MNPNTVYVVSGFMRTGTSMMMRALEEGGMVAAYSQSRDVMKARHADDHYDPNIGGLYELAPRQYREYGFPAQHQGKLIKALNMGIPRMAVMDSIRVVFMRRDPEEIRQSYMAFFGKRLDVTGLDDKMDDIVARIDNRKDVSSLDIFWYREVVNDPLPHFALLQSNNWPIDVERAASVIDPSCCRYRLENLTVGVL